MRRPFIVWIGICSLFYVFDETWFSMALGILLLLLAAFNVVLTISRVKVTRSFWFKWLGRNSEQLADLREVNGRLFLTQRTATFSVANSLFVWLGIPYLCIAIFLGLNWWSVPIALGSSLLNIGIRQLNPAIAVFLSASNSDQIELCSELQYRVFPLKIFNMLSPGAILAQKGYGPRLAALDGNRLAKSANWEDEITSIMSRIPLIIIDLRSSSAGLETECDVINRHGWHWKLVAVHAEGAEIEHLEDEVFRNGNVQRGVIAWVRAADVPKTIVHSIIVEKRLPRIDRPAGLLLIPPDHDYQDWRLFEPHPRRAEG